MILNVYWLNVGWVSWPMQQEYQPEKYVVGLDYSGLGSVSEFFGPGCLLSKIGFGFLLNSELKIMPLGLSQNPDLIGVGLWVYLVKGIARRSGSGLGPTQPYREVQILFSISLMDVSTLQKTQVPKKCYFMPRSKVSLTGTNIQKLGGNQLVEI